MRYDETELAPQTTQKYLLGPVINNNANSRSKVGATMM